MQRRGKERRVEERKRRSPVTGGEDEAVAEIDRVRAFQLSGQENEKHVPKLQDDAKRDTRACV